MTTDLVEKCARALAKAAGHATWEDLPNTEADALNSVQNGATACCKDDYRIGALAVIDALADGVSDETLAPMARAIHDRTWEDDPFDGLPKDGAERGLAIEIARAGIRALSAAIRAAKSREG